MPEDQERLFGGGICASCGRNGNGQNRIIPRGRRRTPVLREASTHSQHCNSTSTSTRIYVEIYIYIYVAVAPAAAPCCDAEQIRACISRTRQHNGCARWCTSICRCTCNATGVLLYLSISLSIYPSYLILSYLYRLSYRPIYPIYLSNLSLHSHLPICLSIFSIYRSIYLSIYLS